MISGNILGFFFLFIGILGGWLALVITHNLGLGFVVGGAILFCFDSSYRNSTGGPVHPFRGGNLFFIPVWLIGIAAVAYGLITMAASVWTVSPTRSAENYTPPTAAAYVPTFAPTPMPQAYARVVAPTPMPQVVAPAVAPMRLPSAVPTVDCSTFVPSLGNPLDKFVCFNPEASTLVLACVPWKDAAKYVGQTICVTGVVYSAYVDNPDDKYSPFIVGFDPAASFYLEGYVPENRQAWKDANLVGNCITVVGTVYWNSLGQTRMLVESPYLLKTCQK